jgi:hypothetical protein
MPHALVVASRSHAPGSALIRAAQGWRAWSHTADVLTDGDYIQTVEALATRGRVVVSTVKDLARRSTARIVLARELPADALAKRDAWLLEQENTGYDFGGAVLAGWAQWREWDDPGRWWCSELTAAAASRVGALTVSPYIRGVMPTQCVDLLLAAGWHVVREH